MAEVDFWSDPVEVRSRVWDDANGQHKMGWLNPGDVVRVRELYPDGPEPEWARFDDYQSAIDEVEPHGGGYNEWWVRVDAFYGPDEEPADGGGPEDPPEEPETNWLVGLIRRLLEWLLSLFS